MDTSTIDVFKFDNGKKEYSYMVTTEIILHICQIYHNLAIIFCTNKLNEEIEFPENIFIYKYDFQENRKIYKLKQNQNQRLICGEESYIVELNDKVILNIERPVQWNIKSALPKPCLRTDQQLQNLIKEFGLSPLDFPVIYRLPPFHECSCEIRQRKDTNQYIMITTESSWRDDTDDIFRWNVIVLNEKILLEYEKYKV
jgi:hypothetical protein